MAKRVDFLRLPVKAWQQGDTVAAYRNGKVVRIPIFGEGDVPAFPDLAAVATSGRYSDLLGLPTLGTAASKNETYFATADQGSKGASAYLWGNHASAGYVKTDTTYSAGSGLTLTDTSFSVKYGSAAGTAAQGNDSRINNGQTAYGWGNHSAAGYALETAVTTQLSGKVDKQTGYGLSQNNFTAAEKAKLAGLEGSHYQGLFTSVAELPALAASGDYADVDAGVGDDVTRYIWDSSDNEWVQQAGKASPLTASEIKTLYEQNPDTNTFSDAEKGKLSGIAANATANAANAYLLNRANHTGTQDVSTIIGLGSASTRNVGEIAGNVMGVGAFGLGASGSTPNPLSDDIDRGDRAIGFYSWRGVAEGDLPPVNDKNGALIHTGYRTGGTGSPFAFQLATSNMDIGLFFRQLRGGNGWTPWREMLHSGNFTPSNYYTKPEVDNLITSAPGSGRIYQAATSALTINKDHKVSFTVNRTLTLPANPAENDYVSVVASAGSMKGSTIARNGKTIMGLAENMAIDAKVYYLRLDYVAGSWRITS